MKINLEYIWLGGNQEFRSKNKIIQMDKELTFEDLMEWNFDGSSTNQAHGEDTDVMLKPVKFVKSPFTQHYCTSYLVLCETYTSVLSLNDRNKAKRIFDKVYSWVQ